MCINKVVFRKYIIPWLVVGIAGVPHSPGQPYSSHHAATLTHMPEIIILYLQN